MVARSGRLSTTRPACSSRYLADLLPYDGSPSLCTALLESGHAVPYMI